MRAIPWPPHISRSLSRHRCSASTQRHSKSSPRQRHPRSQSMHLWVHVATDCDSASETCFAESDQLLMRPLVREQLSSPMRVKPDEVQRWIVSLKDTPQSCRSIGYGFIVASAEAKLIGAWHKRLYNKIANRSRGRARKHARRACSREVIGHGAAMHMGKLIAFAQSCETRFFISPPRW